MVMPCDFFFPELGSYFGDLGDVSQTTKLTENKEKALSLPSEATQQGNFFFYYIAVTRLHLLLDVTKFYSRTSQTEIFV